MAERTWGRRRPWVWVLMVLLAVCAAYANSFDNAFEFDDFHTITDNPAVRSLSNVPSFFTDATTFSVLPANRTYRPFVSASLALDYAMGSGYVPLWFHLSTFLWFLLLIGLLVLLYREIFDRTVASPANIFVALIAAAWFGLHPAMAETVNYVIQRGDLYCTLGCVAALVVWLRYPKLRLTGLYLLPFAVALLSKPPAAVFPVLLFFFVFFFELDSGADRVRKASLACLPAVAVTAALMLLQSAMTPKSFTPTELSGSAYRATQPFVWMRYVATLFLPLHLNVDSDLGAVQGFNWQVASGLLFLAFLVAAIAYTVRQKQLYPIAYGLIWFVTTQLPTSLYPLSEVENDHRMFFSFAGLIPAAVWATWLAVQRMLPGEKHRRKARPVLIAGTVGLLLLYGCGTHVRNAVWHTEESLWLDDVQKSPRNGRGLMIYGLTQMSKGAYPGALDHFTRALEFTPNYPTLETNLGVVYGAMNQPVDAEKHFTRAIALAPGDDAARAFYARWLLQQNRLREAAAEAQQAVSLNPARQMQHDLLLDAYRQLGETDLLHRAALATVEAVPGDLAARAILEHPPVRGAGEWVNLSLEQYRQGQFAQSIDSSHKAIEIDAKSAAAWNNLGASYGALRQWNNAVESERRALQLSPDLQVAKNNLAAFLQKKIPGAPTELPLRAAELINRSQELNLAGRYAESIAAAKSALELDPNLPEGWNNIAAGEEALKHWDAAIVAARKAIALRPDFQLAKNNLAWSESQKAQGK